MAARMKSRTDLALLVLRIGFGLTMLLFHGWGKLTGGPETWERVGGVMQLLGISFAPTFWGFLAAIAETVCSLLLILGLATRPAAVMLMGTMVVAAWRHLSLSAGTDGAGVAGAAHALEFLVVYVTIFLAGPGEYSLDARRGSKRR